jgi:hypothetical protein
MNEEEIVRLSAATAANVVDKHYANPSKTYFTRTKTLLKSYRSLKKYNDNAVYDTAQIVLDDEILLSFKTHDVYDRKFIESIKNSVEFSRTVMAHIDRMLDIWHGECIRNGTERQFLCVHKLYVFPADVTKESIADALGVTVRTVENDIANGIKSFSVYLFGLATVV